MRETDEEIREIKKEIIESRGLIIKTNNLTNSLAADIKSIAKRQAGYERRFTWNGAIAYALFASLSFVGLKLASDARIREIETEKVQQENGLRDVGRALAEEKRRTELRERAESKAARFYDLIRQQKRTEAVEAYEAIRKERLSPAEASFFHDVTERFRLDLAVSAYQNGLDLIRTGRFAEAADAFEDSLRLKEDTAHIAAVKYNLAVALRKLGRQGEAMVLARAVTEQTVDRDLQDDAMWFVAQCAEELGNLDEAKTALRTLQRRWPRSSLALDARKKLAELSRRRHPGDEPEKKTP